MRHAGMPAGFAIFEHLFQNCRIVVYHGIMSTAPRIAAAKRDWGHDEVGCTVLHIDMDAFFASLEVARHPEYADKPVIIGIGNRSVVSAANYEARKYGIIRRWQAPGKKTMPERRLSAGGLHYYREVSRRIFTEVFSASPIASNRFPWMNAIWTSPARCCGGRVPAPSELGYAIRSPDGTTSPVPSASRRTSLSPKASTNAKPDGMLMIPVARHAEFVQMMPLRGIPGIGPSLEKRLNAWGVDSVADLAKMSMESLEQATGSAISARGLYMAARGLDDRPVAPRAQEKSVGAERTFDKDTQDMRQVTSMLRWCAMMWPARAQTRVDGA